MSLPITILYEDQRGPRRGFGLHAVVVSCVYDAIDGERHAVEARLQDARPLKGVHNVLRACCDDIDLLSVDGRWVVAVIDDDAIRRELKLPESAPEEEVLRVIASRSKRPDRLRIALLRRNTESLLGAMAACDRTVDAAQLDRATRKKDLLERDALLLALSRERARPTRDCVLGRMPSFLALVQTVIDCLGKAVKPALDPSPPRPGSPRGEGTPAADVRAPRGRRRSPR